MKNVRNYLLVILLGAASCKKTELDQINPNLPTPEALKTEKGITNYALGIYEKWQTNVPNQGLTNIMLLAMVNHTILGDEFFSSAGNNGWKYVNQVYSITLPNGKTIVNPIGTDQKTIMESLNSRAAQDANAFLYEYEVCYFIIGQANILLGALNDPGLHFTGNASTKKTTLKAWAYWWKGYCYSRIGSMYLAGVINNSSDGTTNNNFVDHNAIISEANRNLDSAGAILAVQKDDDDYESLMSTIIPSFMLNAPATLDITPGVLTPDMWLRQVYTLEARNLLVNKKVKDMTAGDWTAISDLTAKGVQADDKVFVFASDPNLVNDLSNGYVNEGWLNTQGTFLRISERLIQDFKPGDARFTKGFRMYDTAHGQNFIVNQRGRGLQFGTRYAVVPTENGGFYGSPQFTTPVSIAGTYSENALMKAEALIHTGHIEEGLTVIDQVRAKQGAGLAAVAGTGLTLDQALEELRRERRVGLLLRGTGFYDARRWGVIDPVNAGGGRVNANVLVDAATQGLDPKGPPSLLSCTLDYRYMEYWDVPRNELDFNNPGSGSAPVKNQ